MDLTRLIIIRHGETDYNLENKYYGFSDPPLNDTGAWQAERLRERLINEKIDKVYSSDLKRAYQTAKIIFKGTRVKICPDLREMNFGIFEGLRHNEIISVYPNLYKNWIKNPVNICVPQGEALTDLKERVFKLVEKILAEFCGKTIAIVTHGGPIKLLLCSASQMPLKEFGKIEQKSAALNIIEYARRDMPPKILISNDITHLTKTKIGTSAIC